MKNFLNKQREILLLLAYVFVVAGLIYFVILPLLARMNRINDQIQQESMQQESVKLHINELPGIRKQYETLQSGGDLSGVLLDKNRAVVLIEKLEKLAEGSNNEISIIAQDAVANVAAKKTAAKGAAALEGALVAGLPSPDYLQLKITLTGNYNSIVDFIDRLEKFEYYADIIAIQINNEKALSTSSLSSVGMFGAAKAVEAKSGSSVTKGLAENALTASLDSVFYIK